MKKVLQFFFIFMCISLIYNLFAEDSTRTVYGPLPEPELIGVDSVSSLSIQKAKISDTSIVLSHNTVDPVESVEEKNKKALEDEKQSLARRFEFNFDSLNKITTVSLFYTGVAFGDVDNDKKTETVLITPKDIHIFRYEGKQVTTLRRILDLKRKYLVSVDIADINENGYEEIFVVTLDPFKSYLYTFVYEWNGEDFVLISKKIPYITRVVQDKDNKKILMGQRSRKGVIFKGDIYSLKYDKSKYIQDEQITRSCGINVLGMAYGGIVKRNSNSIAAYKSNDQINIFNGGRRAFAQHGEKTGGSPEYIRYQDGNTDANKVYLPARIITTRDNMNNTQLFIIKNYDITKDLLANFRKYKNHHIESLHWNDMGLETIQKTKKLPGFIRDFGIADFNNDGKVELIASVISRHGRKFGKDNRCTLVYYNVK